jgi:signal transduction histidine kinase
MICDEKGTVTFANNTFEKILDSDLSNIYQQHLTKILAKNLSAEKLEKLKTSLENGKQWSELISVNLIHGQPLYFELKLNPIYNESGAVINFVVTANDISYYVFKNQVTKKSENQLKSIINNISDLLIILKQSNEFIYFDNGNDDFFKAFNLNKNEILLKRFEEVLPVKLSEQIKLEIDNLKNKMEMQCQFDFNDSKSYYKSRIVIIEDEYSKDNLYVISLKDITDEEKKKEQLNELYKKEQQLNRLKTTFLQNMSHEIRTPFTAIMGYSDIMVECIEDRDYDTVLEITDSLKSVLNRVMNLFENILEVSEIETGEVNLEFVSMNCNQILKAVANKKHPDATIKNVEMELDLEEKDYLCQIDWMKFERVIFNLVDNAIKYTDKGKIKISSKTITDYVTITISDTGLGINETIINRLLEPFVQEEPDGHLRNYEGAGLGLTIAFEYTKLMNGEMNIKSSKNVGTEIFLNFPLQHT